MTDYTRNSPSHRSGIEHRTALLPVFSVMPFKLNKIKIKTVQMIKSRILKRKKVNMQWLSLRFRSQQCFLRKTWRIFLPKFIEILMETPCWRPSGWRPETNRNICHWVLLQKREFISSGTQKHFKNNTFSNTWTVQIAKFPEISHSFNQHESFIACHVNAASRKSLEIQA